MSKVYVEIGRWGLTIGRLSHLSGEPVGISLWHLAKDQSLVKGRFSSKLMSFEWTKVFYD